MFRSAGLPAQMEQRDIDENSNIRPDIEVVNFPAPGRISFVEVSITNPVSNSTSAKSATASSPSLADKRVASKKSKYAALAAASNHGNFQAVLDTTGGMSTAMDDLVKTCARIAVTNEVRGGLPGTVTWAAPTFAPYWRQRIAITMAHAVDTGAKKITFNTSKGRSAQRFH